MVLAGYTGRRFMRTVSEWDDMRWAELPQTDDHYRYHHPNVHHVQAWLDVGRAWTKLFVCVREREGCLQGQSTECAEGPTERRESCFRRRRIPLPSIQAFLLDGQPLCQVGCSVHPQRQCCELGLQCPWNGRRGGHMRAGTERSLAPETLSLRKWSAD